jgi:hypothetical protein
MHKTINILRGVVLEARTASKDLEYDDPILETLHHIEEMINVTIKKLEAQIGGIDAAGN